MPSLWLESLQSQEAAPNGGLVSPRITSTRELLIACKLPWAAGGERERPRRIGCNVPCNGPLIRNRVRHPDTTQCSACCVQEPKAPWAAAWLPCPHPQRAGRLLA